jgi:hypothetical protein
MDAKRQNTDGKKSALVEQEYNNTLHKVLLIAPDDFLA